MTKQELEERVKELEQMVEDRDYALDCAYDSYTDLEWKLSDVQNELDDLKERAILDPDNFKSRLTLDGLLTPELEREIDEYIRYHNE